MHPPVTGELRMEGRGQHPSLAHGDRVPSGSRASTSASGPTSVTSGARMKTPWSGSSPSAGHVEVGLEAVELAAVAVAAHLEVEQAEDGLVAVGDAVGAAGSSRRRCRASAPRPEPARRSARAGRRRR